MTWIPPKDIDPECIELCVAINKLPGIRTIESCCGHLKKGEKYYIYFMVDSLEALPPLLYWVDRCHSGARGFRVEVYTDCSMCPAHFFIEGPSTREGYGGAVMIAREIEKYLVVPKETE